jgi:tetratricopeptide (TPR) repeat protein
VQSLLTNDKKEGFRFVHQSFYEHFLAYWFFLHPTDIASLLGLLESTLPAYEEIMNEYGSNEGKMLQLMDKEDVNDYTIAIGLHNIGFMLDNLCHYSEAEPFYQEALDIYKALEKVLPGKFIADVASMLNNLAILHWNTNRFNEAEKEYDEALKIYRELAGDNPDAYMPDVAMTLNNLAILHRNTNLYDEAEKEYDEALKIRRELAKKNPDAYMPNVATTLNNLANLHCDTNRYAEAEEEFDEALKIYRGLAEKNPDAYMYYVATSLYNLGSLHYRTNRYDEAEKEYSEALEIYCELAEKNPDAYMYYVATTLYNMALLRRRGDYPWIAPTRTNQKNLSTAKRMSFKSVTFAAWQRNIHHSTTRHWFVTCFPMAFWITSRSPRLTKRLLTSRTRQAQ